MTFAESVGASVIVRGLRAVADFEYEYQMAGMNQQLNDRIETVFLMADVSLQPIASKLVKEIALFGGDIAPFVSPACASRSSRGSRSSAARRNCYRSLNCQRLPVGRRQIRICRQMIIVSLPRRSRFVAFAPLFPVRCGRTRPAAAAIPLAVNPDVHAGSRNILFSTCRTASGWRSG
jgi:hypothetical protein